MFLTVILLSSTYVNCIEKSTLRGKDITCLSTIYRWDTAQKFCGDKSEIIVGTCKDFTPLLRVKGYHIFSSSCVCTVVILETVKPAHSVFTISSTDA